MKYKILLILILLLNSCKEDILTEIESESKIECTKTIDEKERIHPVKKKLDSNNSNYSTTIDEKKTQDNRSVQNTRIHPIMKKLNSINSKVSTSIEEKGRPNSKSDQNIRTHPIKKKLDTNNSKY